MLVHVTEQLIGERAARAASEKKKKESERNQQLDPSFLGIDESSEMREKAIQARTVLRSRLLERKIAEEHAKYAAQRKAQVGTGERNERIRTYNFPQNRVTDHRIELTLYNLPALMEGDLDTVIEPLMQDDLATKLKEMNL